MKAQDNGAGVQSPAPDKVVVFEEGGTLTVLEFSINGQLVWSAAQTGRASNNVEEVTCSFRNADRGELFTATGIFTAG